MVIMHRYVSELLHFQFNISLAAVKMKVAQGNISNELLPSIDNTRINKEKDKKIIVCPQFGYPALISSDSRIQNLERTYHRVCSCCRHMPQTIQNYYSKANFFTTNSPFTIFAKHFFLCKKQDYILYNLGKKSDFDLSGRPNSLGHTYPIPIYLLVNFRFYLVRIP